MCQHLTHALGPMESTTITASRSIQPFLHGTWWWPTDNATLSAAIGRMYVVLQRGLKQPVQFSQCTCIRTTCNYNQGYHSPHRKKLPHFSRLNCRQHIE